MCFDVRERAPRLSDLARPATETNPPPRERKRPAFVGAGRLDNLE
jgi:hypothetical protein